MNNGCKIRVAFIIAAVAAVSIFLTARNRRRGRNRNDKSPSTSCYLHSEPKPQGAFKRVLADNSYTPFKHLKKTSDSSSNGYIFSLVFLCLISEKVKRKRLNRVKKFYVFDWSWLPVAVIVGEYVIVVVVVIEFSLLPILRRHFFLWFLPLFRELK